MTMKHAFTSNAILDCMTTATFRFHRELNEFLSRPQRGRAFVCACSKVSTPAARCAELILPAAGETRSLTVVRRILRRLRTRAWLTRLRQEREAKVGRRS